MDRIGAFLASTLLAFAVSGALLLVGWSFDTLDLFTGAAFGLVLGFIGLTALRRPGPHGGNRSPAAYALAGGTMGLVNFCAACAAVAVQAWLRQGGEDAPWMKAVLAVSGGWMVAKAASDPGRLLVIAVASVVSGLIAGFAYGAMVRRRPKGAEGRLTPARP